MRECTKCKLLRPLAHYYAHLLGRDGLHPWCKGCMKDAAVARRKLRGVPRRNKEQQLAVRLRRYGLGLNQYNEMLLTQQGACALCLRVSSRDLVIDHCHESGRVRGLLCVSCNVALVPMDRDAGWARRATEYLARINVGETA